MRTYTLRRDFAPAPVVRDWGFKMTFPDAHDASARFRADVVWWSEDESIVADIYEWDWLRGSQQWIHHGKFAIPCSREDAPLAASQAVAVIGYTFDETPDPYYERLRAAAVVA